MKQLKLLRASIIKYETEIGNADKGDLNHSNFISFYTNIGTTLHELYGLIDNLYEWAKARSVDTPIALAPATSYILPEPMGVVLVMGAWNFNFSLSIIPLATAIAAGNVVLLKPSEMAPYSAKIIEKICS